MKSAPTLSDKTPSESVFKDIPSTENLTIFSATDSLKLSKGKPHSAIPGNNTLEYSTIEYIAEYENEERGCYTPLSPLTPHTPFNTPYINSPNSDNSVYSQDAHSVSSIDFQPKPVTDPAFTWAFFNCPTTMKIAGLLLLAGGLFTLLTGIVATSAALATTGMGITCVGALLTFFGHSSRSEPTLLDPSPLSRNASLNTEAAIYI